MTIHLNVTRLAARRVARATLAIALLAAGPAAAQTSQTAVPSSSVPSAPSASAFSTGVVEFGSGNVSDASFKAGEFNGLQNKGVFGVANFNLRGGGAYDSTSAFRWHASGTDLGLADRTVSADIGVQGRFRAVFAFDQLQRNRSDSYQTPYLGTGTNTLTLPSTWLLPVIASSSSSNNHGTTTSARGLLASVGGASYLDTQTSSGTIGTFIAPNTAQLALVNAASAADTPLFQNVNLFTDRKRYDGGFSANLTPEIVVEAGVRAEHKDGMKPMGTVSRNTGGDISTIIPDLIDTDTSQVNVSGSYRGGRGFLQAGYYGSFFTNHVSSMSWQNWASATGTINTMSSAPNNTVHQFNAEGRYNFTSTTRLVANASYAHNTQNDLFLTDSSTPVVPVQSLNGLVLWKTAGARLTSKVGAVSFVAAYKFDDRDNHTGVHIFQYADAGESPSANALFTANPNNTLGAVVAQNANANRPYSKKSNQATFSADYGFAKGQWIKAGYDFERINRWCNGSWIDCADAGVTNENRGSVEWRAEVSERLNARVDYSYAARRAPNYNDFAFLALVPYANVTPTSITDGATALSFMQANALTGWGPAQGLTGATGDMSIFFPNNGALANTTYANNNRISEIQGLRRYYVSDRNRNRVRTLLDFQATEALSFEAGVDYTGDVYPGSTYGLQNSKGWGATIDGSYEIGDGFSATVFYTFERQRAITAGNTFQSNSTATNVGGFTALSGNTSCDSFTTLAQRNSSFKLDPCLNWSADMLDLAHSVGFNLLKKAAKLTLSGDAIYTRARSTNDVTGGSWANNLLALAGQPASTVAALYIPATSLPPATTNEFELRANGTYEVAAHQSIRVLYAYLRMRSADWSLDGTQIGAAALSGVLPSNETPFSYGIHVIGVSYVIGF